MKKYLKPVKIFLTALLLILSGCNSLPDFPQWSPYITIPSENKKFQCHLVDTKRMIFQCEPTSTPLDNSLDGSFCTKPDEQVEIIDWVKKVRKKFEQGPKSGR